MRVLLLQFDGKLPNLALMRLSAWHRERGDDVTVRTHANPALAAGPMIDDPAWDKVYGSLIFERTRPIAEAASRAFPGIVLGGTGWSVESNLAGIGVPDGPVDYGDYFTFRQSMGFTQRGCRLRCSFCVVPRKEGQPYASGTIPDIWRGDPWPREILLLDNDFFGVPEWPARIRELQDGKFKVSFNQGINARMLTDETAAAIASVDYRADDMKTRRIYTAWDNRKDEDRLFAGLEALTKNGVKPDAIMVYVLCGYCHHHKVAASACRCHEADTFEDRDHRRRRLREFGARPYPMAYELTRDLRGFQRWVIGAYDKSIPWAEWERAGYDPRGLGARGAQTSMEFETP